MAKVKFVCNSGANIHSAREDIMDLERDLGISLEEWKDMDEDERFSIVQDWANDRLEIYYVNVEE